MSLNLNNLLKIKVFIIFSMMQYDLNWKKILHQVFYWSNLFPIGNLRSVQIFTIDLMFSFTKGICTPVLPARGVFRRPGLLGFSNG
ncbi:MAG: hypothetical protein CMI12_17350 [Oceanospirillum sp.]|nr:hypothetical protein [Oceanospirillum sp.]